MSVLTNLKAVAAKWFRRDETAAEMDEEIHLHIERRADDLERDGLTRAEAERRARIEFGSREYYKEESYAALGGHFVQTLVQDLQFALRILRKSKGFTFAAVVTLALAIGANAVVFGVLDALVLHTLNVPDAKSLYGTEYGADHSDFSRIRATSICAIGTTAFRIWRRSTLRWVQLSIPATTRKRPAVSPRREITSRFWMCIHTWAGCTRSRTNMERAARRIWC